MTTTAARPRPLPAPALAPSRAHVRSAALASLLLLAVCLVGLVVDDRTISGAPAWLKPLKFAVSVSIYLWTIDRILSLVAGHRRAKAFVTWTATLALVGELVAITLQVVRGTTSHFNLAETFDAAVFDAMGGLVSLVFVATVVAAVLVLRQRVSRDPAMTSAVRGGLAVCLIGMAEAGLMLANISDATPGGAHTVGGPDGGPGLPLTGWSTAHGDLRVAHFVGLHALQALPVLAWLLARFAPTLGEQARLRLVRVTAVGGALTVALLAYEAELGLPVTAPDARVLVPTAAAVVLGGIAALAAVRAPDRQQAG